ncbi:steroid transmembrane transporter SLC22A24-like [Dermacentor andersoni]|uniref:steroid transmembrane transporter SLC22A24-like n=1 Tax=Dermacentor andersoni TaxID=34620 RepID=UPI002415EE47|nr:solute carrier family 22 member 7-like [Dermacentor andersoni]
MYGSSPFVSMSSSGRASPSNEPSTVIPFDDKPVSAHGDLASVRDPLLEGFVISDDPERIQENVYVILGHGSMQRHVLLCGTLSFFVMLLNTLEYKVIGHFVDHWCRPPDELRHLNATAWKVMAIPVEPNGNFSRCNVYDPPVQDGPDEERRQVPCRAWDYDTDRLEDSIVSRWDLVCDNAWLSPLSSLTYMLGAVLFTPVAGYLADRVGRTPIIKIAMSTLLVASIGACVADTFLLFLLTRFVVSGSAHSIVMVLYILLYEVTGSEHRTRFAIIDTAIAFTLAPRIVNGLSRLTPRWSLVQAAVLLPTAVLAFWCYQLDESPAWLLATWNIAEAERSLMLAAKRNGLDLDRAMNSYRQLREQLLRQEMRMAKPGEASGFTADGHVQAAFLFQTRIVCVALSWFTLTMVFYTFTLSPASDADNTLEIAHLVLQVYSLMSL